MITLFDFDESWSVAERKVIVDTVEQTLTAYAALLETLMKQRGDQLRKLNAEHDQRMKDALEAVQSGVIRGGAEGLRWTFQQCQPLHFAAMQSAKTLAT